MKNIIYSLIILIIAGLLVFFVTSTNSKDSDFNFKYGLDLSGGTHLVYRADTSSIADEDIKSSMESLRDVIERRTNLFGVSEPLVQVQKASSLSLDNYHLIVELPGIDDLDEALNIIGQTPVLEFKLISSDSTNENPIFVDTGLTGKYLQRASLQFQQTTNEPAVSLKFDSEGSELFAKITRENIGQILAIFLDGQPISTPVIRQEIRDGSAEISGGFTPQEARDLARDLNFGALPVPIDLASSQSIGASLGSSVLSSGVKAGATGLLIVALFLILWYRLPGIFASISLLIYVFVMLAIFKFIPVVLTASGIAGFILSVGMAVDANVLIFERIKEELRSGKTIKKSVEDGFSRAWLSIRDGNISSILTAIVLFWFGTSVVEGFALTFGLGVLISMLTAIIVTRTFLLSLAKDNDGGILRKLFSCGIKN